MIYGVAIIVRKNVIIIPRQGEISSHYSSSLLSKLAHTAFPEPKRNGIHRMLFCIHVLDTRSSSYNIPSPDLTLATDLFLEKSKFI
jgi:hypothetical protein